MADHPGNGGGAVALPTRPAWRDHAALLAVALLAMAGTFYATTQGIGLQPDSVVYLQAARNLAAGHGLIILNPDGVMTPMTHFPPLLSAVLALPASFGADVAVCARWLNILCCGITIFVIGALVRAQTASLAFGLVAAVALAASAPFTEGHASLLSEPLFLLLLLTTLANLSLFQSTRRFHILLLAAIAADLACLTRYLGLALIACGLISILMDRGFRVAQRARYAALFGLVSCLGPCLWLLHNHLAAGSLTGRQAVLHPIDWPAIAQGLHTFGAWMPLSDRSGWIGGLQWLALVALWWSRRKLYPPAAARSGCRTLPHIMLLFMVVYVALLLVSRSLFDARTRLDHRILSPVHMCLLCCLCVFACRAIRTEFRIGWVRTVAVAWGIATLAFLGNRYAHLLYDAHHDGVGYNSLAMRNSPTMHYVAALPADALIYSNSPDGIYALTGRATRLLPQRFDPLTTRDNPNYLAQLDTMNRQLRAAGGLVVYVNHVTWRDYLPTPDQLRQAMPLTPAFDGRDGTAYKPAD